MEFNIHGQYFDAKDYLDVRAGFSDEKLRGSVKEIVRRGNVTVGLTSDGKPVYVRIRCAEERGQPFVEYAERIKKNLPLTDVLELKVMKECLSIMEQLAREHYMEILIESLAEKNIQSKFESVLV